MRVFLCDDEPMVLDGLSKLIHELDSSIAIQNFYSMAQLLDALSAQDGSEVDGIFIDIVFAGHEETGEITSLHEMYPDIPLVFITGHLEYAPHIFEADPTYLLEKPFSRTMLEKALQALRRHCENSARTCITVRARDGVHTLRSQDIDYIASSGRKVTAYGSFAPVEFYAKLSELEAALPESFARCHQSFLVNMDHVSHIAPDSLTMFSGDVLPMSRRRSAQFRAAFARYQTHRALGSAPSGTQPQKME